MALHIFLSKYQMQFYFMMKKFTNQAVQISVLVPWLLYDF